MNPGLLLRLAVGDFRDRSRRYGFLVILVAQVYAAYLFLPSRGASYSTIDLDGYRGIYNSSWIGANVAVLSSVFLSLIGFYLVKNSIERDRSSGVGQILAATPLTRRAYLVSKTLSNFLVFGLLIAVLMAATFVMQIVRAEDLRIDPWQIISPSLLLSLPILALVSALAVLFESVPFLAGTGGNVLWFFFWSMVLLNPIGLASVIQKGDIPAAWADPTGIGLAIAQMIRGLKDLVPGFSPRNISVGVNIASQAERIYVWNGIQWTPGLVFGRLLWLGAAFVVSICASAFFDRFDPSVQRLRRVRSEADDGPSPPRKMAFESVSILEPDVGDALPKITADLGARPIALPAVALASGRLHLLSMIRGELNLMRRGLPRWWLLAAGALFLAGVLVPPPGAARVWAVLWIWMLPLWSSLGCRDRIHGTTFLLHASPRPLSRQLPAAWLAGVVVAFVASFPMSTRFALAGDAGGLAAVAAGVAFVPSLALAAGAWSGNRRLFEAVFLLLWYIGPMQQVPALDFIGATATARHSSAPAHFGLIAVGLLAAAWLGRRRDLRR